MNWIGAIVLTAAGIVGGKLVYQAFLKPPSELPPGVAVGSREHLREVAAKINATLPRNVDSDTRLTQVRAREREIIYEMELIRYSSRDIDFQAFVRDVGPQLRKQACATAGMRVFWKNDITATYNYTANDQFPLGSVSVSKADCGA